MENGYASLRDIEKLCKTDIRFIWLLDGTPAPSFVTISNFLNDFLIESIEDIFNDINSYIFEVEDVDLNHVYIDGTKLEANANKYTWVWKKACITNRNKIFTYLTELINEINDTELKYFNFKIDTRTEYSIEYIQYIFNQYIGVMGVDTAKFVHGKGKRKTTVQKHYEKLEEYTSKFKKYAHHINICIANKPVRVNI
jgi:hypothetical protein